MARVVELPDGSFGVETSQAVRGVVSFRGDLQTRKISGEEEEEGDQNIGE